MAKLKQTSLLAFAKVSEDKHEDCNDVAGELRCSGRTWRESYSFLFLCEKVYMRKPMFYTHSFSGKTPQASTQGNEVT